MQKINSGIRTFFLSLLIYSLALGPSFSQSTTASLLPNAVQQFFDNNGNPLTSGTVDTYNAGTSTRATTWKDSAETLPNTNPIKLDAGGKAIIYGNQTYRQVVKDRNGNLIWDAVTAPGGGGGSTPTLVGDGNLVGTVLPWSGLIAPNQYVFAYGQEIARATYPDFYTATTQQLNVICSAASNILTGLSDTQSIRIGEHVELALCVPAGSTVTAKTTATITLSNPSNVSINTVATFFPWGNGNGSTTFNVPDYRGVVLAGRDNMGGTSAGIITTSACLNSITPDALGANCGSATHTQTLAELASHSHSIVDPGHSHTIQGGTDTSTSTFVTTASGNNSNAKSTLLQTTGITITITGSNVPFSIIQPTTTINYIVKIIPDTSTSIATGVWSIGGMSGIIACGTGILCSGNIISFDGSTFAGGSTNNVQYNGGVGALAGSPNFNFISPDTLTLGAVGTTGKFDIFGSSTGKVRQVAQAAAGTPTITWGTSSGTPAATASSPLAINSTTGNITCATCATTSGGGAITASSPLFVTGNNITISPDALTRVNDTNVTLTLSAGASTATISPVSLTLGWNGQLSVPRGGTGLASGNSGGVLYFNSTTSIASSALLTVNQIMIGGGAGNPPTTFACATTTTVIHGGTPPTCGQIVSSDITTNTISNDRLVQAAAVTLKGNPNASLANVQDFTIQGLSNLASPSSTLDFLVIYDHAAGTFKSVTPGAIASAGVAGVSAVNTLTGALTLNASGGLNIASSGTTITITPDIATAANFEAGTAQKLLDANVVFSPESTTTFGTTTAFDFNTFINTKVTLTGNITTMNCSNMKQGQAGTITYIQDGTGSRTAAFSSGTCSTVLKFANATFPTLTLSASALDILSYSCRNSTYCAAALSKGYNP